VSLKPSVERYATELKNIFAARKAVVFLCGPSITDPPKPGAALRQQLKDALTREGFEVVLGEDDGLESIRKKYSNYAHENELMFIKKHCYAVVLVASSVGAYCELGLFSYKMAHDKKNKTDFILIISEEYRGRRSYLIEGPAAAIEDFGKVYYGDLGSFDYYDIITRLKRRRSIYFTSFKGRPAKGGT
jgi:hypothetical protein